MSQQKQKRQSQAPPINKAELKIIRGLVDNERSSFVVSEMAPDSVQPQVKSYKRQLDNLSEKLAS